MLRQCFRLDDHLGPSPEGSDTLLEPDCVSAFDLSFSLFGYEHLQVCLHSMLNMSYVAESALGDNLFVKSLTFCNLTVLKSESCLVFFALPKFLLVDGVMFLL